MHRAVMHCKVIPLVLLLILAVVPIAWAEPYEVLVIDVAAANNIEWVDEFKKDAEKLNSLHDQGYSSARPYFNLLHMANGQVYFVFGFKGEVQGIHRLNYPKTEKNLRRMKHRGARKYPDMHWLPVEDIRTL